MILGNRNLDVSYFCCSVGNAFGICFYTLNLLLIYLRMHKGMQMQLVPDNTYCLISNKVVDLPYNDKYNESLSVIYLLKFINESNIYTSSYDKIFQTGNPIYSAYKKEKSMGIFPYET